MTQNGAPQITDVCVVHLSGHISETTWHGANTKAIFHFVSHTLVYFERAVKIFQSGIVSIAEAEGEVGAAVAQVIEPVIRLPLNQPLAQPRVAPVVPPPSLFDE